MAPDEPPAPTTVPFVALERQNAALRDALDQAWSATVATSGFILGDAVDAFESDFAAYCEVGHCVGVASGTAALQLALRAAGVGPGDEVIVPAHTFVASALAVLHAGATPVFCDVEAATGLLDPRSAAAVVTERTAAVVPVHLYGQVCDMDAVGAFARPRSLFVLEDAAQAHGARWRGRPAGSLGDAAAFSFYPSKNLGALGDGGAVTTTDAGLAERVRELRHLGQRGKGNHVVMGVNERLDGLQAAFLRAKLPCLDEWNARRRDIAERFDEALGPVVDVLPYRENATPVYHLYPVLAPERDALAAHLRRAGVSTGLHYHPAAHRHEALRCLLAASTPIELSHSERWAAHQLSLPIFAEMTDEEIDAVIAGCLAWAPSAECQTGPPSRP